MDRRKSPTLRLRRKNVSAATTVPSDSEGSIESNSPSVESNNEYQTLRAQPSAKEPGNLVKRFSRRGSEWEILEGLKDGQRFDTKPSVYSGYLHKKRKWPLKGWHKRYFVVDKGILTYGKSPGDIARGKIHGHVDIGLSVISTKSKRKRLDIDAEEFIYHLKAKTIESFMAWLEQLKKHRLFRQHTLTYGHSSTKIATDSKTARSRKLRTTKTITSPELVKACSPPPAPRLATLLVESNPLEQISKDLNKIEQNLNKLEQVYSQLAVLNNNNNNTTSAISEVDSSSSLTVCNLNTALSTSNPSLPTSSRAHSFHGSESANLPASSNHNLRQPECIALAKEVVSQLKSVLYSFTTERDRLKLVVDNELSNREVTNLKNTVQLVLQQNSEIRSKLSKIHELSDLSDLTEAKGLTNSLSYSSSCVSASEQFFDAEEYLSEEEDRPVPVTNTGASDSSSEAGSLSSEEETVSSENSELGATDYSHDTASTHTRTMTGRRTKLPCPRPDTESLSLWNLLCKNIGKDLSQVSMPVALNEPLNMLQRMCEELEYSELLDKAAELSDPYERMVYVAAFAVSSYGSSHFRAGSKPFNPLLGETYECIREDKGFKFIAEQVSHHPPVSVCHAESKKFIFWQDVRIKTKFWGKSMEFQPNGSVNVKLLRSDSNDHYTWNKVTTCVHNLFGNQRWVDQYGELKITNLDTNIVCKLTFVKASYWSAKRHEVYGAVLDSEGKVQRKLFGKWNEALYCGVAPNLKLVWRLGTMPKDYEMYYGFTRFAIELNELTTELGKVLPSTDTRFRPDQRLLEVGNLNGAETLKLKLEQNQRDRRKKMEEAGIEHEAKWFKKLDGESWEYNGKYWDARRNNFDHYNFEALW